MARSNAYTRDCLLQGYFRAGLYVESFEIVARRPRVANVRGSDAVRIFVGTRTVFSVYFRACVPNLIGVERFALLEVVAAEASTARNGNASAVNAARVRLFVVEDCY